MRMRKKPNLAARMEKCAQLLVAEPEKLRGRWLDEFGYDELHVEIGCGKGRFTVGTAIAEAGTGTGAGAEAGAGIEAVTETEAETGAHAEAGAETGAETGAGIEAGAEAGTGSIAGAAVFIAALEKSADAMIIALERANAIDLRNVSFINGFAENLADYFAPGEVSRIYLNFCDPWPSNRHVKRRLTNRLFLEIYMRALKAGGEIHFKTDNLPLFDYSLREFAYSGFKLTGITRDLHKNGPVGIMTDYERKFYDQGLPICKCVAIG